MNTYNNYDTLNENDTYDSYNNDYDYDDYNEFNLKNEIIDMILFKDIEHPKCGNLNTIRKNNLSTFVLKQNKKDDIFQLKKKNIEVDKFDIVLATFMQNYILSDNEINNIVSYLQCNYSDARLDAQDLYFYIEDLYDNIKIQLGYIKKANLKVPFNIKIKSIKKDLYASFEREVLKAFLVAYRNVDLTKNEYIELLNRSIMSKGDFFENITLQPKYYLSTSDISEYNLKFNPNSYIFLMKQYHNHFTKKM